MCVWGGEQLQGLICITDRLILHESLFFVRSCGIPSNIWRIMKDNVLTTKLLLGLYLEASYFRYRIICKLSG